MTVVRKSGMVYVPEGLSFYGALLGSCRIHGLNLALSYYIITRPLNLVLAIKVMIPLLYLL